MGLQLGEQVVYGEAGDLVFKPRDVWHSFWNAGDEPARLLEVNSPAGFEHFFVCPRCWRPAASTTSTRLPP